ncbi:hypothetical protein ANCDUO_24233 [Ancylostoma duodenale]|uniref:Uncharacterized protein n=1 Tax=Ancylostoma duodenale TaxID=51022 RepID=A0A0C2BPF6_9BILA|nr:hypothetical protein ANCDUO_24233 [Ancylostoma duodenale]
MVIGSQRRVNVRRHARVEKLNLQILEMKIMNARCRFLPVHAKEKIVAMRTTARQENA